MSGPSLLLALHSSSETFALAVQALTDDHPAQVASFPLGRRLSNELLACVEELLPADQWRRIGRLVVATGPGGFTGTRLTVVFARTLAQQLAIPLHGYSSFLLMAHRLAAPGQVMAEVPRFWLTQELPRRGVVAGCYGPAAPGGLGELAELEPPRLFRAGDGLPAEPRQPAVVDPEADALQLLQLGQRAAAAQLPGPWQPVLPLYPTSPVDGL
jgi:tRNA threonylcarbamoyl adenosine modification protein YeaZ